MWVFKMNELMIQKLIDILTDIKIKGKDSQYILKGFDTNMRISDPTVHYNRHTFLLHIYEKRYP